jgi:hypothetical protein
VFASIEVSPSDERADELLAAYSLGIVPLSGWATPDLVALMQAIDDELEERDDFGALEVDDHE